MRKFARYIPAKVRRTVAQTNWSDGPETCIAINDRERRVCPVGLAILTIEPYSGMRQPFSYAAADYVVENPELFVGTKNGVSPQQYETLRESFREFMNDFDNGLLDNKAIADAFGYPELAQEV